MTIDLSRFFDQYEGVANMAQNAFDRVEQSHSSCVRCKIGCDDCCSALFDLTLVEALYINDNFNRIFQGKEKDRLLALSNRADRKTYKIKRAAYRRLTAGKDEARILMEIAAEKVRCPLLNEDHRCELYAYRPITCRLYGIPTAIGGAGYTCGKSGFTEGQSYPTANLEPIQKQLYDISAALVLEIGSKHTHMAEILVPLSMALLTSYNDSYLGVGD